MSSNGKGCDPMLYFFVALGVMLACGASILVIDKEFSQVTTKSGIVLKKDLVEISGLSAPKTELAQMFGGSVSIPIPRVIVPSKPAKRCVVTLEIEKRIVGLRLSEERCTILRVGEVIRVRVMVGRITGRITPFAIEE